MNRFKNLIPAAWLQLDARHRRLSILLLAVVAVAGAVVLALWLRGEHIRLTHRETDVVNDLRVMQADLADVGRLKARVAPPRLTGQPLQDSVVTSLASQNLALSVSTLDAGRLRVQGSGDFDTVVRWLGNVQQNHRLGVASLSATRDGGTVAVDLILSATFE